MTILVGTSGFSYDHWSEILYPSDLKRNQRLKFYTQSFPTVELNVTFYRLPKKETFERWHKIVPEDFTFAVKGSRYITHIKRLKDVRESVQIFKEQIAGLREKLMVILWQLPPQMKADLGRLEKFINDLKVLKVKHTFEFRHKSWFCPEVYKLLEDANYALCIADSPAGQASEILTADWIYFRFHGGKELYASEYSKKELNRWARKIEGWGRDGYFYFNNDYKGFAVENGLYFKSLFQG